ncbi:MAG: enterotoxin [Acidobacteriaceae bacterium]|nr:enterotoxin [Acidobacteriaceae bacterium]
MKTVRIAFLAAGILIAASSPLRALDFPGPAPGSATGTITNSEAVLQNGVLAMQWTIEGDRIRPRSFTNKLSGVKLDLSGTELFQIVLADTPLPTRTVLNPSELRLAGAPKIAELPPNLSATRAAERYRGRELRIRFAPVRGLVIAWTATLRDGANYLRQALTITGGAPETDLAEIVLLDVPAPGVELIGRVDGVPAVAGQTFFAYEHPLANMTAAGGRLRGFYPYVGALPSEGLRHSSVIGVFPAAQQRRGFLYYIERERAHPYRVFFHHNNGEDTAQYWALRKKQPEQAAKFRANQQQWWEAIIQAFGRELAEKRGARIDAFVHDWTWDDETLNWQFHNGYPQGFTPLLPVMRKFGAAPGIWLSPWGGYSDKPFRIPPARLLGMETNPQGLSLAGPRYYGRFRAACAGLMKKYGVNYFKFDGFNGLNSPDGSTEYRSDVEALLKLIRELRAIDADVFINPSSGTWPSPFWLLDADCIWRGGHDTGEVAKGSPRQQWITFRDSMVYASVLGRSPLYPISSLMIHGIEINDGGRVKTFDEADMVAEIRSFFATGVNHQDMFIMPERMTPRTWDALAESAKWSRANAEVLADTHWIGGDPAKYEIYGWASWSKTNAILSLRNPDDHPASYRLDVRRAFELPVGAPIAYELTSAWKEDSGKPAIRAVAGEPVAIDLAPFQVLVLDATAAK